MLAVSYADKYIDGFWIAIYLTFYLITILF
jgi:hypothetical protein